MTTIIIILNIVIVINSTIIILMIRCLSITRLLLIGVAVDGMLIRWIRLILLLMPTDVAIATAATCCPGNRGWAARGEGVPCRPF